MKLIWEDKNGKIRISEEAVAIGMTASAYIAWRLIKQSFKRKIPWI